MYLTHYDPFFDGMRRLFGAATLTGSEDKTQWITPPVDVREDDHAWTFLLDLPGVKPGDIDVHVDDGELVVNASHTAESRDEREGKYIHIERAGGAYQRRFTLPGTADAESISAKSEDGVLSIVVAKKEEVQPKKIAVDVS